MSSLSGLAAAAGGGDSLRLAASDQLSLYGLHHQRKRKLAETDFLRSLDFPFSNLMRTLAARAHIRNHVLSVLSPSNSAAGPTSLLPPSPSSSTSSPLCSPPLTKKIKLEEPLDLSLISSTSSEDCKTEAAAAEDTSSSSIADDDFKIDKENKFRALVSWDVEDVVEFVSEVDGLKEYAGLFRKERIDGLGLLRMSLDYLTTSLGVKIGPAIRLITIIHQKKSEDHHHLL